MIKLTYLRAAKFKQLDDLSLAFPDRGSVLVQGLNEAGKSTLFESIFFALYGKGLVTEDNSGRMDDLIHYQAPRALVRLGFSVDGSAFTVTRSLNRGKANTAQLEVAYANGKRETVTNLTAVNRRLVAELGLDGEALLNSCFVEQKKLEKIETMTAQQRRDTLLRLLNLDRLAALEAQYKPTSAEDYQLQQLRDRLKLAEIQRDVPLLQSKLAEAEAELRLFEGVRLQRHIVARRAIQREEESAQNRLSEQAGEVAASLREVDNLKEVRDLARATGEHLSAIEQDRADIAQLSADLEALRADAKELPELERELDRLHGIANKLAEIERREHVLTEQRRDRQRLTEAAERVGRLQASLEERQRLLAGIDVELDEVHVNLAEAEARERQAHQAELLREWLQIREVALLAGEAEAHLGQLRQDVFDKEQAAAERDSDRVTGRRVVRGMAVAGLAAIAIAIVLAATGHLLGLLGLAPAAVVGWFWVRARRAAAAATAAASAAAADLAAAHVQLNREEGAQQLAARTNQDPRRLAEVEAELESAGIGRPASVEAARASLQALAPAATSAAEGSHAGRQRLGALEGRQQALWSEMREIKASIEREGDPESAAFALDEAIAREDQALAAERAALVAPDGESASERPALDDAASTRELAAAVKAACQAAKVASTKAGEVAASLAAREQRLAEREQEFTRSWQTLQSAAEAGHFPLPTFPSQTPAVDDFRQLWRSCGSRLAELDEPRLRAKATEVTHQLAASQERGGAAEREARELQLRLDSLGLDQDALAARADASPEDELAAQQAQRDLIERLAAVQDRQSGLEQQLGLQRVSVDYDEAAGAVTAFEEQCDVRRQAFRIVTLARKNIVAKVLPSTMRNMGLLLPLLTNDRYRDVDISDDYKIRVWDDSARALKAKDIFSGGTRDQFSLALRLAFALATLPEELGTAPGFIFLDEPLSSFDDARTEALVNLLTRGLVADNFEQIFVISHNRTFDEQLFDYHLYMEDGRITASDLPAMDDAAEPAQMTLAVPA